MTELWRLGASGLTQLFNGGRASPVEALEACLERIDAVDPEIQAFTIVLDGSARDEARLRTDELARGFVRGRLHGIPVAVKELFDVRGAKADYGSDVLAGSVATEDAELVRRLRRAGAVIVGTTRSHEFGWGITTQHQHHRSTRNPWDLGRVPGGSSGGSAAAVAAGMVPVAIGSDTGGSIRIPAGFCGIAGLKPTFGRIPRTGGVALAPSLDTPGALARTVGDAATVVEALSGPDGVDPACRSVPFPSIPTPRPSLDGLRIGLSDDLFELDLDAGIAPAFETAVDLLQESGAVIVDVRLPSAAEMRAAFVPFQMAEAYHVHHRVMQLYPRHADRYGPDVRSRLEAAAEVTIGDYLAAVAERERVVASFEACFQLVDALISPISAVAPPLRKDSDHGSWNGQVRPLRELVMGFTVPQNLTGLPTSITRIGSDGDGLPVGVQVTTDRWREDLGITVAAALEFATADVTPSISTGPAAWNVLAGWEP